MLAKEENPISPNATTCSYYYMSQGRAGIYTIIDPMQNKTHKVYCHFDKKLQKSWTLVLSFSLANNKKVRDKPFWLDIPYKNTTPNFKLYRLLLQQMNNTRKIAKEWTAICNYDGAILDRLDTVRGEFKKFDPMVNTDTGSCVNVKYINVRGKSCKECSAKFFQTSTQFLHVDSS